MQIKPIAVWAFSALSFCFIFTSCKKDNPAPKPVCKIITASITPGTSTFNFTYNDEGNLVKKTYGNYVNTYQYSGNTVTILSELSGVFSSKQIVDYGSNGLASNSRTEYNPTSTTWNNEEFTYSGNEVIKSSRTNSLDPTPEITTIEWNNGNISSIKNASTVTFEYLQNEPSSDGDYFWFMNMTYNYEVYAAKNLLKSYLTGTTLNQFTYDKDSDGKIIKMYMDDGNSKQTVSYQYQCD